MKTSFNLFNYFKYNLPGWVKINTDGAVRCYSGLATCGGIFRGSMREFIGGFSAFIDVQIALVVEFCGVIYVMKETQNTSLTNI